MLNLVGLCSQSAKIYFWTAMPDYLKKIGEFALRKSVKLKTKSVENR
jgi:hypothetical protein